MNVPHAFADRLHQFRFCSFPEYSTDYGHVLHLVGADGERSRQRRRSATDAAHPLRVHIGPFVRLHRTAVDAAPPQPCLRRPTFSAAPEKVGKKRRWRRVILRAHARDFLAAPRPERPLRAQNCDDSDGFRFRQMYHTYLWADCINFGSAHFRNTRLISFMHCTL